MPPLVLRFLERHGMYHHKQCSLILWLGAYGATPPTNRMLRLSKSTRPLRSLIKESSILFHSAWGLNGSSMLWTSAQIVQNYFLCGEKHNDKQKKRYLCWNGAERLQLEMHVNIVNHDAWLNLIHLLSAYGSKGNMCQCICSARSITGYCRLCSRACIAYLQRICFWICTT